MATTLVRIQLLSKTSTDFATSNPVLLDGEVGVANAGASVPVMKVGDGVRPWSALPDIVAAGAGADYVAGPVNTLPAGSPATVVIDNGVSPPTISFGIPAGATGPQGGVGPIGPVGPVGPIGAVGPANELSIGVVSTGAPGSAAAATITGTPPAQVLNLAIPAGIQGPVGAVGPAGPANSLAIGSVTTGAPGSAADATITGVPPNQTLSLTIPQGAQGIQGIQGPPGASGSGAPANPTAQVGLAAVNGVAVTFTRSDGAPALSQAIAPTWTGPHVFTSDPTTAAPIIVRAPITNIVWDATSSPVNERRWDIFGNNLGQLLFRTVNDAVNAASVWMQVDRTGTVIDSITLNAVTVINGNGFDDVLHLKATNPYVRFDNAAGSSLGYVQCSTAGMSLFHGAGTMNFYVAGVAKMTLSTAGELAIGASLRSPSGLVDTGGGRYFQWNTSLPFGTAYIQGTVGGYAGVTIYEGPGGGIQMTLMASATSGGLYGVADSKWLLCRTGPAAAFSQYSIDAPSFNTTSSRKLKRETGKPSRAADILTRLRPIMYRLLEKNSREQLGMIAEEVAEVCPQLSNGKTISYDRLAVLLLADWQEARGIHFAH